MNHLYGKLNTPLTIKSYTGINTETANTTVDNKNNTIKVDVNTDTIATVDYVNEHIGTFTGEITLSGDEELVLQIQNGRLYHEGELYTGDITFSDEYIVGDVNGDDVVNQEDVEYLLMHVLFPDDYPLYPDDSACDFNKDGVVNDLDVEILSDYLSTHISEYSIGETSTKPIITLNVQEGFTYFEGNLYTDTVELSGDDSTLYIIYENGLVKNITTTNPNLDGTVRYDIGQELTDVQKGMARDNIGAAASVLIPTLVMDTDGGIGNIGQSPDIVNYVLSEYLNGHTHSTVIMVVTKSMTGPSEIDGMYRVYVDYYPQGSPDGMYIIIRMPGGGKYSCGDMGEQWFTYSS